MKRIAAILMIGLMLLMVSCSEKTLKKDEITVFHATDMHYLSQQLTVNSSAFVEMIRNGDGKMIHYIEPIMNAFVDDVISKSPDYVIISGDITFNGERLSHIDFAEKLKIIEKNGTQVVVIPGNHDVDYPFCYGYGETQYYPAERMTDEEFEKIYADYGLKQSYSRDENSFSYMYRLTDRITLIALDTNRGTGTGVVSTETLKWLEKELEKISEDTTLICTTHQNLLSHFGNESFTNSYSIINNRPLVELFQKYNVKLNLSGHIHTQHIYKEKDLIDIATESMAVLPCNYGVITINSNSIDYKTQPVNVQLWAIETGITDENLIDFNNYANNFYVVSQKNLSKSALEDYNLSDEEIDLMAEFFAELNVYYFSGKTDEYYDYLIETDGYKKWLEKGKDLWHYQYIMARMEEGRQGIAHDSCHIDIK
ncbi:MAG: metallophosphoesterase [Oscillospiraceae bacterium]|nr:metallophosphoesterase [Oscillospiraceae bacterium]